MASSKTILFPRPTTTLRSSLLLSHSNLDSSSSSSSIPFLRSICQSPSRFLGQAVRLPNGAPAIAAVPRRRELPVAAAAAGGDPRPTVLVAEKLGEAGLALLREHANVDWSYQLSPEELCVKISSCDALIVRSGTKVTPEVFEAAKGRLRVVGRAGVGIDNVDLQAATELVCLVVNAPTANTVAAAEHGIALLAAMARNVAQADSSLKAGKWQRSKYVGVSLVGKTLAVVGFGKVGSEVARRAKGPGMHVIAHDPYAPADRARAVGVELVSFDEAGAGIIIVARGGVIDEDASVRALDNGTVAQAALDVFTDEPPPKDGKLVKHENITVTPHLGPSTVEAQEGAAIEIAEAVVGALKGELAATAVNAPMVPSEVLSEPSLYAVLAEKLGRLAVQLVAGGIGIRRVKVVYNSHAPDPKIGSIISRRPYNLEFHPDYVKPNNPNCYS